MIQCLRFVHSVQACGSGAITLVVHPALKRLCQTGLTPAVAQVLAFDDPVPHSGWDCWSPLMSLPGALGVTPEASPWFGPYVQVPPALQRWGREVLSRSTSANGVVPLRIGVVWRGNPQFENDEDRSLPGLGALGPLAEALARRLSDRRVQWVSLQKGGGEDEAAHPPVAFADLWCHAGAVCTDFAETAAVVAQLDAVVSVDTAVAHLAGAMGRPCALLLPAYKTDWRWLTGRKDTLWYPHTRLFRQPEGVPRTQAVVDLSEALVDVLVAVDRELPKIPGPARMPSDP